MTAPNATRPIIEENRTMQQDFRAWTQRVERYLPIIGTGSPEGVVEALQFSLYIDDAGASGSIEYRKMQTDIAGDKTKGWVAV